LISIPFLGLQKWEARTRTQLQFIKQTGTPSWSQRRRTGKEGTLAPGKFCAAIETADCSVGVANRNGAAELNSIFAEGDPFRSAGRNTPDESFVTEQQSFGDEDCG